MVSEKKGFVWLITGATSGLGYELALQALSCNDKVIATGRAQSLSKLDELRIKGAETLELDVTAPLNVIRDAAKKAMDIYERVDVLVNNAGYAQIGTIEETTPEDTYKLFNTNLFGALNVTRAFLPYMRARKTGTIVWMGSIAGRSGFPYVGIYAATKWALRGVSQTLHEEISSIGLRSICIDFGYFRTPILSPGRLTKRICTIPDYKEWANNADAFFTAKDLNQPGDPVKGVRVILDIVHDEGKMKGISFPLSLVLGSDCYDTALEASLNDSRWLEEWKGVSCNMDFDK